MMTSCSSVMSTSGAYTIDTSAYTVLTTEKAVLKRPCSSTVTVYCVDSSLAKVLQDSRIILMTALHNYQDARKSYNAAISSGSTTDEAAVKSAYTALQDAITSANSVLALSTVQEILKSIGE